MNNTAIISTLSAIVVAVVVLIFTEGTLTAAAAEAAATSSFTPQLQNLICTHTGDNPTCSQGGIISTTTTQIPLPMPQSQPPAALAITRHVIDDIVGTISAKDFSIGASGTNVSPQSSFQGAQSLGAATAVTSKPGTFPVALLQQANATVAVAADHNKCSSGDGITCTHNKETHYPAKDTTTTPFVLPIPFP
jgi:hypothetical protein